MSPTIIGLATGIALGFAVVLGGLEGFFVVAVFAVIGLLVGRVLEGELDLEALLGSRRRRERL